MSDSKKSPSLRDLSRKTPTQDELHQAYDEIDHQKSDRAAAIIAASFLEDSLRFLLERRCVQLSKREYSELFDRGPLSSFEAMIKIGFAFDFYRNLVRDDLDIIRQIRNAFAHAMVPLSFDTPQVISKVDGLKVIKWKAERGAPAFGERPGVTNTYRNAYLNTCRVLTNDLYMEGLTNTRPHVG